MGVAGGVEVSGLGGARAEGHDADVLVRVRCIPAGGLASASSSSRPSAFWASAQPSRCVRSPHGELEAVVAGARAARHGAGATALRGVVFEKTSAAGADLGGVMRTVRAPRGWPAVLVSPERVG